MVSSYKYLCLAIIISFLSISFTSARPISSDSLETIPENPNLESSRIGPDYFLQNGQQEILPFDVEKPIDLQLILSDGITKILKIMVYAISYGFCGVFIVFNVYVAVLHTCQRHKLEKYES